MAKVINSTSHPVDLDTGRSLAPGEVAEDVDTEETHNRVLVAEGLLTVLEGTNPRVARADKLVSDAAKTEKEGGR
jgi:hypothetical protein